MFQSARIKLTLWYVLILMSVSLAFSTAIYRMLSDEFVRFGRIQRFRIERRLNNNPVYFPGDSQNEPLPSVADPELIEDSEHRVILMLLFVNGSIFVCSGILAYLLAGRTLRPIQQMMDLQYRFISDASHEFRTPLTSLKAAMEVYLREKKPTLKEAKTLVSESLVEVNALQSLSEALLELSTYEETHSGAAQFSQVKLNESIEEAIKMVRPLSLEKKITIDSSLVPGVIDGHEKVLQQLWVILLDNAIKYSNDGATVKITASTNDGSFLIKINDQGIGIAKKDLPFIFDRFYRANRARSKVGKNGFGLGLAIAKEVVTTHHGSIAVESEEGKGTTVTVKLPKKQKTNG